MRTNGKTFSELQRQYRDEEWSAQASEGKEGLARRDAKHRDRMYRSGQRQGAVGSRPTLCTRYLLRLGQLHPELKSWDVFDFGAGKWASQTTALRDAGFSSVTPYDIGPNRHDAELQDITGHRVVLLSNVLNVQDSIGSIHRLLRGIRDHAQFGTFLVCNLPQEPRYGHYSASMVETTLIETGWRIVRKTGTHAAPVWVAVAF